MKLQQSKSLFLILFLVVGTFLSAQSDKMGKHGKKGKDMSVEEKAQMKTDRLTKSLELNDEQIAQVYEINLRQMQVKEEKRKEKKGKRQEKEAQIDAELKEILTPEQYEKFLTNKDKKKGKRKGKREGRKDKE